MRTQKLSFLRTEEGNAFLDQDGLKFFEVVLREIRPDLLVLDRRAKWASLLRQSLQATDLATFGASPYERSTVLDFRLVVLLKCG